MANFPETEEIKLDKFLKSIEVNKNTSEDEVSKIINSVDNKTVSEDTIDNSNISTITNESNVSDSEIPDIYSSNDSEIQFLFAPDDDLGTPPGYTPLEDEELPITSNSDLEPKEPYNPDEEVVIASNESSSKQNLNTATSITKPADDFKLSDTVINNAIETITEKFIDFSYDVSIPVEYTKLTNDK
jgi:hypothetical protein